jgi:hypothetical protein
MQRSRWRLAKAGPPPVPQLTATVAGIRLPIAIVAASVPIIIAPIVVSVSKRLLAAHILIAATVVAVAVVASVVHEPLCLAHDIVGIGPHRVSDT